MGVDLLSILYVAENAPVYRWGHSRTTNTHVVTGEYDIEEYLRRWWLKGGEEGIVCSPKQSDELLEDYLCFCVRRDSSESCLRSVSP